MQGVPSEKSLRPTRSRGQPYTCRLPVRDHCPRSMSNMPVPTTLHSERRAALQRMDVLDTPEERAYDDITRMAADIFGTPMALISLLPGDRQWFKSRVGIRQHEMPSEYAFCEHAVRSPDDILMVPDARKDARFSANPLVTGYPNIRFYAGAPLVTSGGHAVGTLCVLDTAPRDIDGAQLEQLRFLAQQVVTMLEAREQSQLASADSSSHGTTA